MATLEQQEQEILEFRTLKKNLESATATYRKTLALNSVWVLDKDKIANIHKEYINPQLIPYIIYDVNGVAIDHVDGIGLKDYETENPQRQRAYESLTQVMKNAKGEVQDAQQALDDWLATH
jgi:hypothetical protein